MAKQRRQKMNRRNRKTREKLPPRSLSITNSFVKTIRTFFPKLGKWVRAISDPRNANQIDYDSEVIVWVAIFVGLLRLGSMRNINLLIGRDSDDPSIFLDNFKSLFPLLNIKQFDLEGIPHYDTVIRLINRLDLKDIEQIFVKMLRYLIRKKALEKFRLVDKYYQIAIDGSRILKFNSRHCDQCLSRKIKEDDKGNPIYEYYHYVLDAKLVTSNGLSIPIFTEFIENKEVNPDKQDCELKGFYRLAKKIRAYFPRLPIVLLLDSLYAAKPVFDICKKYNWKYIVRFKEGSIPTLDKNYQDLLALSSENKGFHIPNIKTKQSYQWVNRIDYEGHAINFIEMNETKPGEEGALKTTLFRFISNLVITTTNFKQIVKGGRCRWVIENEGFQALKKKDGYNAEHAYILDPNGFNCFYLILQIGYTINQFIEKGSLIKAALRQMGSIKNYILEALFAFSKIRFAANLVENACNLTYQIRLDSS